MAAPFQRDPFPPPRLEPAATRAEMDRFRIVERDEGSLQLEHAIFIMRQEHAKDPTLRAYRRIRGRFTRLWYQGQERGTMYDCQVLRRVGRDAFEEATEVVKIKQLHRRVVEEMVNGGHPENAYNEISVLQDHGTGSDDIVECLEALIDEHCLYLIMPFYNQGSLDRLVPREGFLSLRDYDPRPLLLSSARNLVFIHDLQIVHRDFSPEQVLIHGIGAENEAICSLTDFAMAARQTVLEGRPQLIVNDEHPCGKLPYMPPEIMRRQSFGPAADVWCWGGTLFFCLTGMHLYSNPFGDEDQSFQHFFVRGGLLNDALNRLVEEALLVMPGGEDHPLLRRIQALLRLDPLARALLARTMKVIQEERITAREILDDDWFQGAWVYREV